MRIVVPIKQVPETSAVKMDEETGTMVRDGVEAIVNPLDLYAVESAIRLRDAGIADEVVALSMGPPKAESALREVVAMGCDRAVLVSDRAFAASDTWATSYVLAAAIEKLGGADLVLCGERATDGDTGQVGPGIAAFLDQPVVTYVSRIETVNPDEAVVDRLVEDGYECLAVTLPAVLTVVKEVSDPRLPTLMGKRVARALQVEIFSAADLNVDSALLGLKGSPTRVVKIFRPKVARECELLVAEDEDAVDQACDRVVEFLR
ncbi:MAG: electron transfer flavoprotein subunit beta/FixA family protein, partial [Lentisphaeria bacterium]|nr:electron transfer flavoprotein subunit beta/FixA family protein [Lentisphaeria bacterium]